MKLYAQLGWGDRDKTSQALAEHLIDGVLLSPRDISPEKIGAKIETIKEASNNADVLLDPQFYATFIAGGEAARAGKLPEWNHFRTTRKSDLEDTDGIDQVLREAFAVSTHIATTAIIAPNVYVSRSFDSRDGVIAKNFIRRARAVYDSFSDERPLFVTLSLCREALLEREEFEEFLTDITRLKSPPDGFYLLVGSRGSEASTDIMHADVIARWMLLNRSLSINGFRVINGFSDVLTPFMGVAGAEAGATGWWSNLRMFSLDRFSASSGMARQPIPRYFSAALLNRITFAEKDAISKFVPAIVNQLPHDSDYDTDGAMPDRTGEALQSWEAIKKLNTDIVAEDIQSGLDHLTFAVDQAQAKYAAIGNMSFALDRKSRADHLAAMHEGIRVFRELAGLA